MVHDFSEDDEQDNNPIPTSSTYLNQSFSKAGQTIQFEFWGHFIHYKRISHWIGLQICGCGVQDR